MWLLLVLQLSLCAVTVTSSKFSHVILEQPNSCGGNEQVLSELKAAVSQIQNKLDAGGANTGNTSSELKKTSRSRPTYHIVVVVNA